MKYGFDLMTSDDGSSVIAKSVENLYILREKEKNKAVFGEIARIATENGIDTYLTLNEKAIINAFEKQIPRKPRTNNDGWLCCPKCDDTFKMFDSLDKRNHHCGNCGQALDWSDEE